MSKTKNYYWLKLKKTFFEDDEIEWLEDQENGKAYCMFYLKLCLKSMNSDGILIRKVGNSLMPYDEKKLAEITKTSIDTTVVALELLKAAGLLIILDDGRIWLPKVSGMVGKETTDAERMREKRKKIKAQLELKADSEQCSNNVRCLSEICSPELEKEKELLLRNNNSFSLIKCGIPDELKPKFEEIYRRGENL